MKKRILFIVCAIMLTAAMLAGCTSSAEKAAAGDYTLSDVEFTVTMGAIGVNKTTETLKGSEIGYRFTDDFCGFDTADLQKLYNAYKSATLSLSKDKKAELTYGANTENFTWKISSGAYVTVSGLNLSAITDDGDLCTVTSSNGYLAESDELWFTVSNGICTVKYVFKK